MITTLPSDAALAALCVDSYAATPAGHVIDTVLDRAVIVWMSGYTIVTVRGTADTRGWWSDFQISPRGLATHPELGECEAGFLAGAVALYPAIKSVLDAGPIILTGHSRGAAMLPILAALMKLDGIRPAYCCGFEAPWSVGPKCRDFVAGDIPGRQYRNGNDPVPDVPALSYLVANVWPITQIGRPMLNRFDCHAIGLIAHELALAEQTPIAA